MECEVDTYNLTPLKGNYIVKNGTINFYISVCEPGNHGVGGLMELDNSKNYVSK